MQFSAAHRCWCWVLARCAGTSQGLLETDRNWGRNQTQWTTIKPQPQTRTLSLSHREQETPVRSSPQNKLLSPADDRNMRSVQAWENATSGKKRVSCPFSKYTLSGGDRGPHTRPKRSSAQGGTSSGPSPQKWMSLVVLFQKRDPRLHPESCRPPRQDIFNPLTARPSLPRSRCR